MVRRHALDLARAKDVSVHLTDTRLVREDGATGGVAERQDESWRHSVELFDEPRTTRHDLLWRRCPIRGRSTLHDVGDVALLARETDFLFQPVSYTHLRAHET